MFLIAPEYRGVNLYSSHKMELLTWNIFQNQETLEIHERILPLLCGPLFQAHLSAVDLGTPPLPDMDLSQI